MSSIPSQEADVVRRLRTRTVLLVMRYSLEVTNLVERLAGVGTSGNSEVQVLSHLHHSGPSSRQELLALTGMSRSGVAQLVERLAALGLVETYTDPRDHRMVTSALTPAGRRRVDVMNDGLAEFFKVPNSTVTELLDLLQPHWQWPTTTTDNLDRIAELGARLVERFETELGIVDGRQRIALAMIADHGDTRPGELADQLGLTSAGVTYLVDQLEFAGIVKRIYGAVPTDRRAVIIRLSSKGWAASERFADVVFEHADELVEVLATAHAPR